MSAYLVVVQRLTEVCVYCNIRQVPQGKNSQGYALKSLGSSLRGSKLTSVPIVHLAYLAIEQDLFIINNEHDVVGPSSPPTKVGGWTKPFVE